MRGWCPCAPPPPHTHTAAHPPTLQLHACTGDRLAATPAGCSAPLPPSQACWACRKRTCTAARGERSQRCRCERAAGAASHWVVVGAGQNRQPGEVHEWEAVVERLRWCRQDVGQGSSRCPIHRPSVHAACPQRRRRKLRTCANRLSRTTGHACWSDGAAPPKSNVELCVVMLSTACGARVSALLLPRCHRLPGLHAWLYVNSCLPLSEQDLPHREEWSACTCTLLQFCEFATTARCCACRAAATGGVVPALHLQRCNSRRTVYNHAASAV